MWSKSHSICSSRLGTRGYWRPQVRYPPSNKDVLKVSNETNYHLKPSLSVVSSYLMLCNTSIKLLTFVYFIEVLDLTSVSLYQKNWNKMKTFLQKYDMIFNYKPKYRGKNLLFFGKLYKKKWNRIPRCSWKLIYGFCFPGVWAWLDTKCGTTRWECCYLVMEHGDSWQEVDVGPPQETDRWK